MNIHPPSISSFEWTISLTAHMTLRLIPNPGHWWFIISTKTLTPKLNSCKGISKSSTGALAFLGSVCVWIVFIIKQTGTVIFIASTIHQFCNTVDMSCILCKLVFKYLDDLRGRCSGHCFHWLSGHPQVVSSRSNKKGFPLSFGRQLLFYLLFQL